MSIDEQALKAAKHVYDVSYHADRDEISSLRCAIIAYEHTKAADQPDDCPELAGLLSRLRVLDEIEFYGPAKDWDADMPVCRFADYRKLAFLARELVKYINTRLKRESLAQARKEAFERAAQLCRYYIKHQNYTGENPEYESGVEVACSNLSDALEAEAKKIADNRR